MTMATFSHWLYGTSVSQTIQNVSWIIPTIQSIHIVAIAVLAGSAIVLDLKLAGFIARTETSIMVFRRYMPWLWSALAVLLATGVIMVVGEPERTMLNWVFWTKMSLLAVAIVITLLMSVPVRREARGAEVRAWAHMVKPLGVAAILVWILIITCGRWIAYAM